MKKKDLNVKLLIRRIIVILVLLIILVLIMKLFSIIFGKEKVVGNLNNRGLALSVGKEVYYNKYEKGIYKVKGNKEYQLTDETAYSITNYKDKLYYLTVSNSNSIDLKSVDTNGENQELIKSLSTRISKFYIEDGFVYYVTNKDVVGLAKFELETKKESIIATSNVQDFVLDNKTIYYTDNVGYLYKVNIDGTNNEVISRDYSINQIQLLDKWIYYYDSSNSEEKGPSGLYKIKKDGTSRTLVSENINNEYYNITSKSIYYYDISSKKIIKTNLNGKNSKEITQLNDQMLLTRMNIANGVIYYLDKSIDDSQIYQMYRIKEDGKKSKSIEY